jgi:hypothetical protein
LVVADGAAANGQVDVVAPQVLEPVAGLNFQIDGRIFGLNFPQRRLQGRGDVSIVDTP